MKTIIASILIGFLPISIMAQWHTLSNSQAEKTAPVVQLISDDQSATVIKVDISGFDLSGFYSNNILYQSVDLLTDVSTSLAGLPELPYISTILAVPDRAGVSVEIVETGSLHTFSNINLPLCRESWFEGQPQKVTKVTTKQ